MSDLKSHIESQFHNGMSWENYGRKGWHIEHIIPMKAFNFISKDDIDFKRCWALKNIQPIWAKENHRKSASIEGHFQPSLLLKYINGEPMELPQ